LLATEFVKEIREREHRSGNRKRQPPGFQIFPAEGKILPASPAGSGANGTSSRFAAFPLANTEPAMRLTLLAALVLSLAAPAAHASTPDAWEQFRADVEKSCLASLPEALGTPTVFVEPTGTETFGIAAIEGLSPESKSLVTYVCIYDKQKKTVEVSPPIAAEFLHVVRESEREAAAKERAATGDDKTVDEAGQE
jgi:hypothetical protein